MNIYQLKNKETVNLLDPISTVFANRGINKEDIEWYVNPQKYEYDSTLLRNIEGGVRSLLNHIENGSHIHVQIDKDL